MKTKSICEYGLIYPEKHAAGKVESTACVILPDKSFELLCDFVATQEADYVLKYGKKQGQSFLKAQNYVGVIETADGTTLEILPKVQRYSDEVKDARHVLLKMLRYLRDSPYKEIEEAHLKTTQFPILEVFISAFVRSMQRLIRRGIKNNYVSVQDNQFFLKGKLLFNQHLRKNITAQHRFFVEFDEYLPDIPQNRLLKSCCQFLLNRTRHIENQNQLRHFLMMLDLVPSSVNLDKDFRLTATLDRTFIAYEQPLRWAKVFLQNQSFTNFKGKSLNQALLFPMERIFEDYVSAKIKSKLEKEGYTVFLQHKQYYLVDEHRGCKKFRLKPDIVAIKEGSCMIFDAKWKLLNAHAPQHNYDISQADMYQLFGYGSKYKSEKSATPKLFLIYPEHECFQDKLAPFDFVKDEMRLEVLAWLFDEEIINIPELKKYCNETH